MKTEPQVIWENHSTYETPHRNRLMDTQECIYRLNDEFVIKKDILTRLDLSGQHVRSKEYIISLCRLADLDIKEKRAAFLKMPVDIIMTDDEDEADEVFEELRHQVDG